MTHELSTDFVVFGFVVFAF